MVIHQGIVNLYFVVPHASYFYAHAATIQGSQPIPVITMPTQAPTVPWVHWKISFSGCSALPAWDSENSTRQERTGKACVCLPCSRLMMMMPTHGCPDWLSWTWQIHVFSNDLPPHSSPLTILHDQYIMSYFPFSESFYPLCLVQCTLFSLQVARHTRPKWSFDKRAVMS